MNDWDAHDAGVPNHWQLYIQPVSIDLDVFDFADIVGNLLENALDAAIDTLLGPLPDWAKDLIHALLGPVIDVVRDILDIGDDVQEWLEQMLGTSLGLINVILASLTTALSVRCEPAARTFACARRSSAISTVVRIVASWHQLIAS